MWRKKYIVRRIARTLLSVVILDVFENEKEIRTAAFVDGIYFVSDYVILSVRGRFIRRQWRPVSTCGFSKNIMISPPLLTVLRLSFLFIYA